MRLWKTPVPVWLTTRLVGRLAELPLQDGELGGVKLGPIREVRAADEGLYLQVGD